jgi:uncharacterized membrane protein
MPRFLSIDVLRGVAILLMVQTHFVENLSQRDDVSSVVWLYDLSQWLGMIPASLFTFVSGLSFCLWTRQQRSLETRDDAMTKFAVRRGLFLFVVGIAFNFFVWSAEETFNWDILTLIGAAMILLAFARKLPPVILLLICLFIVLLSPALRVVADYPAYWEDEEYSYDFTYLDVLTGFVANGYFPLFPWLVFPFAGFIVGQTVFKTSVPSPRVLTRLTVIGLGFLLIATIAPSVRAYAPFLIAAYYIEGFTEFPATTTYVFAALGMCLISFVLLYVALDRRGVRASDGAVILFLSRCSAHSLTIYIVHHAIHLWPLWLYSVYQHQEDTHHYLNQAMSTPMALALAAGFIVVCYIFLMWRGKAWKVSFEALMRWLCD